MLDILMECLYDSAQKYNLHPYVIQAIAYAESGGNPWALGIKSREELNLKNIRVKVKRKGEFFLYSVFPRSKAQAMEVIRVAEKKGVVSIDYGLMQINDFWLRKFKLSPEQILDPCTNLEIGAYIISYCRSKKSNEWEVIECYHASERVSNPGAYAERVCKILYGEELCRF